MADVKAIRDRLATRARTVAGINVMDFMPSTPVLPAVLIAPPTGTFLAEVSMDGAQDLEMEALVLVSKAVDENAQNQLDTYASEGVADLVAALDSGATADWDFAQCQARRGYGQYTFGTGEAAQMFLGFVIPILVAVS